MRKYSILLVAVALLVLASPAMADPITGSVGIASKAVQENFNVSGLTPYGKAHDGVYEGNQADFAEKFFGQSILTSTGGYEYFPTTPTVTGSLALVTPSTGAEEVYLGYAPAYSIDNLSGIARAGGPVGLMTIGEGVLSAIFDMDQTEIGFDVTGVDYPANPLDVLFWGADGTLVDRVSMALVSTGDVSVNFVAKTGTTFRGISIANQDIGGSGGVGYDNFRYDVPVPEPTSIALFGLGAAGLAAYRRRRKTTQA